VFTDSACDTCHFHIILAIMRLLAPILHFRYRIIPVFFLSALFAFATHASAASFSAPDTLRVSSSAGSSVSTDLIVTDLGSDAITVHATPDWVSSIWHINATLIHIGADTTHTGHFVITFSPSATGTFNGRIALIDSVSGTVKQVYLIGTATGSSGTVTTIHPELSGSFLGITVGTTVCHSIIIHNPYDSGSIVISSAALLYGNRGYTLELDSVNFPYTIAHGGSLTLQICFSPTHTGDAIDTLAVAFVDRHDSTETAYLQIPGSAIAAHTDGCFKISGDSTAYGPIDAGGSATRTMELSNTSNNTWVITRCTMSCDSGIWSLTDLSLPLTLAPNSSSHFTVHFHTPSTSQEHTYTCSFTFHATDSTGDCSQVLNVEGHSTPHTATIDTTTVYLQADTTQTIDWEASYPGSTSHIIRVRNNTGKRVKVDGYSLKQGTKFSLTLLYPDSTLPFYVSGDGSIYLLITLTDTTVGTYDDSLLVTTEFGIASLSFGVHSIMSAAGVANVTAPPVYAIAANPNPSRGQVAISLAGMRAATVQVLDILGRVVAEATNVSSNWRWNGNTMAGMHAASGRYIVRATGVGENGNVVTASTRIVVQR
jgi:hypothetical protein